MSRHYLVSLTGQDDFFQHESCLVEVEDRDSYETAIKYALDQYDAPWVADVQADDVDTDDAYLLSQTADHYISL